MTVNLIACHEWLGPSRHAKNPIDPIVKITSFCTRLEIGDALAKLREYQEAYNRKHQVALAIEFDVFAVSTFQLDDLSKLEEMGSTVIEKLSKQEEPR